jgi:hypothetical protein
LTVFCLNFFHLLAPKPNLEKFSIYSNKFFHNFHLSESSFTCPGLRASGLARRLIFSGDRRTSHNIQCLVISTMILQVVNSIGISCLSREHPNVSERSTDTTLYMPKIFT